MDNSTIQHMLEMAETCSTIHEKLNSFIYKHGDDKIDDLIEEIRVDFEFLSINYYQLLALLNQHSTTS